MSGGRDVRLRGQPLEVRHALPFWHPFVRRGCRLDVPTSHKSATESLGLLLYGSGSGGSISRRRLQSRSFRSHEWEVRSRGRMGIAIWLILPVVIRSSQRLSHACLSINDFVL